MGRQSQRVKEQDILKLQVLKKMRKYIKSKEESANKLARAVYSRTTSDTSSVDEVMKANQNTTRSVLGSRSGNVFTFQQLQASAKRDSDETPMVEKPSPWIKGRTLDEKSAAKSLIDMKNDNQDKQDSDDDYSGDSDGDKEEKDAEEELESRMEDSRKKEGDNISPKDLGMGVSTDEDAAASDDDEPEPSPLPRMSDFDFVVALKEFPDETKAFDDAAENFSKMLKDAGRDSLQEYDTKHARVMSLSANNSEDKKGWLGARSKLVSAPTSFQQITSVDELDKEIKEIEEAINRKEKMMSEGDVTRQSQRVKEQDILKLQVLEKMRKYIKSKEESANTLARAVYSRTTSDTSSVDEVMKANQNTTRSVLGSRSGNVFTFQQLQASAKRDSDETPMVEKPSPWIKGRTLDEKSAAKSLI